MSVACFYVQNVADHVAHVTNHARVVSIGSTARRTCDHDDVNDESAYERTENETGARVHIPGGYGHGRPGVTPLNGAGNHA